MRVCAGIGRMVGAGVEVGVEILGSQFDGNQVDWAVLFGWWNLILDWKYELKSGDIGV